MEVLIKSFDENKIKSILCRDLGIDITKSDIKIVYEEYNECVNTIPYDCDYVKKNRLKSIDVYLKVNNV